MSKADQALLQSHFKRVTLGVGKRLESSNRRPATVYFPESGLVSMVAIGGTERRQAHVALVGREGMTGLAVVHGADRSPCDMFMQVEGEGLCIQVDALKDAIEASASLLKCFLLFSHTLAVQSAYTALANAQGHIDERLARWLLMVQDRLDTSELKLTHESFALMLGVRRAGITTALQALEEKGLIETARGSVIVKDRNGLAKASNSLYGAPEAEFKRLFGPA
jgi:CRP-like cAMP-binding protein